MGKVPAPPTALERLWQAIERVMLVASAKVGEAACRCQMVWLPDTSDLWPRLCPSASC
jgi:hypothetical protein